MFQELESNGTICTTHALHTHKTAQNVTSSVCHRLHPDVFADQNNKYGVINHILQPPPPKPPKKNCIPSGEKGGF
jgi:hypothetical protein